MILESIRNFDWYNDPQNVRFVEEGMLIETRPHTDFWQNVDNRFFKDDGHLFAKKQSGDFVLTVKWSFPAVREAAQCGLMFRSDARNWIKAGLLSSDACRPQLGVVSADRGSSDWSIVELPSDCRRIWLRLRRRGRDFVVWQSPDGISFRQIRMLHLPEVTDAADAGAYACSPGGESFECVLEELDINP